MKHQKWFLTCVIILREAIFHWDIDYRTQHRFGGKYRLSFRHVGFRFQWEIKVSTSSRQLNIQVWSSGEEHRLKKGFESHPSNAIPKGWGEDSEFCLQPPSLLPERTLSARIGQRKNVRWRLRRACGAVRGKPGNERWQSSQGRKCLRLLKVWGSQAHGSSSIPFFISDFLGLFPSSWVALHILLLFNFWCSFSLV